jgi:hypothetical protein
VSRSITPLMVATSIAVSRPKLVLRARSGLGEFGQRRPLRRRQIDSDLAGEDRGVALPHLAQDEADLLLQNIGGRDGFRLRFGETLLVIFAWLAPRSQRQMRVANVRTRVEFAMVPPKQMRPRSMM